MSSQLLQVTPHIVGLIATCTRTYTNTVFSSFCTTLQANSLTFIDVDVLCAFSDESNLSLCPSTHVPCRPSTCVHAAIVNISVLTDGKETPSDFAVCFRRRLIDHTIDPDSLQTVEMLIKFIVMTFWFSEKCSEKKKRIKNKSTKKLEKYNFTNRLRERERDGP